MAAVQFKIKVSEAGALGLFGQSTGDAFVVYNESTSGVLFGSTSQKKSYVEVVAVAKDATHYPSTIYTYSGTISKKVDGYWHTQWTGNNTASSPSSVTAATKSYTVSTFPVTVVDEHGTHLGTPNCTSVYFLKEAYIGFLHQTTNAGYTFDGWTITITRTITSATTKPTFASSETGITSETSGLDLIYTVPASYEGAVIFKPFAYYTSAIVVKANYKKDEQSTETVSWMADGATFAITICTVGGTYELPGSSPIKDGYSFSGWFTAESGGEQITATTNFTATSPVIAYAQWTVASIRLPFCVAEDAAGKLVLFAGQIVNGTVFLNQSATTSSSVEFSASTENSGVLGVTYIQVVPLSARPLCSKVNSGTKKYESAGLSSQWTGNDPTGTANEISISGFAYSGSTYSVTVRDEHGEHIGTQNCEYTSFKNESTIGVKHTSTNRGWKFLGWRFTGTTPNSSPIPVTSYWTRVSKTEYFLPASVDAAIVHQIYGSSVTIVAEYEAVVISVGWMVDGVLFATTACDVGSAYVMPSEAPTKTGYVFEGWFTSESGGDEITEQTVFTETSSVIVYAQWSGSPSPGPEPGPSGGGTGLMVRSASSDFLVFSASSGALVYDA